MQIPGTPVSLKAPASPLGDASQSFPITVTESGIIDTPPTDYYAPAQTAKSVAPIAVAAVLAYLFMG